MSLQADPLESWKHPTEPDQEGGTRIISIADLGPSESPDWIWTGYLARGAITLFTGLWKAGKTTLLGHLLRDLDRGEGLCDCPMDAPSLVCSEETDAMWARRRDELRLPPSVHLLQRPSFMRPTFAQWPVIVEDIAREVRDQQIGLVVFDTLPSLWPVINENDAGETINALTPLRAISDAGAALLLIHHPRKGGGTEGQGTRGSGSLPGFVDILLEMHRYNASSATDTRRTLRAMGRYDGIPPERVISLEDDGYTIIGDRVTARTEDDNAVIATLLPEQAPGMTCDEVLGCWPNPPTPGKTRLRRRLNHGARHGLWIATGAGSRGNPVRFTRRPGELDSNQSLSILSD